jgi:hypothetical protein
MGAPRSRNQAQSLAFRGIAWRRCVRLSREFKATLRAPLPVNRLVGWQTSRVPSWEPSYALIIPVVYACASADPHSGGHGPRRVRQSGAVSISLLHGGQAPRLFINSEI